METFFAEYGPLLAQGTLDTVIMTIASTFFAYVIGLPLGIWFAVTTPTGLAPNKPVNTVLGWIINIGRSIPFIILLVAIIPFTRLVVGTSYPVHPLGGGNLPWRAGCGGAAYRGGCSLRRTHRRAEPR